MPTDLPVMAPGGFAPLSAIGFTQPDISLSPVTLNNPLPVSLTAPDAPQALAGTTATSTLIGPFTPAINRPVVLALGGTWSGSVKVLRSADNGATKLPLTAGGMPWAVFTTNCCEPVWEENTNGRELYLDVAVSAGSLTYRMEQ